MAESNLKVNITGDSSKLKNSLSSASSKLQAFGSKMQSVGKSMSTRLTLPLIAAGAAATKMAFDFDKSMGQIESLVGIAGDEVKKLGETAKKMAIDTGRSANEAAEALFFITSAGLEGAAATDTLNASLKASAVGLGETKTIADLATSAMNAYGQGNLNASGATDVLVSAVRLGKLEASELAGAMGGVLPIASNMGVQFHEVGAALAAMSKTGTNAANGATQLNAIMTTIAKPTAEAEAAFGKMGFTSDLLKQTLAEQGLIGTLSMLKDGLDKTGQEFTDIAPNVRAWKGILDLTGSSMEDNIKLFDEMTRATGATDEAFEKTSQTASFKMTKGLNAMKSSFLEVGQIILQAVAPAVEKIGEFFTNLTEKFKALSPTTQKIILAFVGIVAALGPIIAIIGTLMTLAPAIGAAFTVMMGPIGLIVAALAAVAYVIYNNWAGIKAAIVKVANYFIELYNESLLVQMGVNFLIGVFKTAFATAKFMVKNIITVFKALGTAVMNIFGSIGDIIMGVLTLDIEKIKKGFSGIGNAMKDSFNQYVDGIKENAQELADTVADNVNEALTLKKIDPIVIPIETEEEKAEAAAVDPAKVKTLPPANLPMNPVLDQEGVDKLKQLNKDINEALLTSDAKSYQARKQETTAYYDNLISQVQKGSEREKALQQAKTDTLAQMEMDENARMLETKQEIADASNASDEEQKALEIERIQLHYEQMRLLALENGLLTAEQQAAFDAAQAEAEQKVYDDKKARFLGFITDQKTAAQLMQKIGGQIDSSFGAIGNSITEMFGGAQSATGAFVGTLAKDALQILGHNLKIALGGATASATESAKSFGPAAAFVLPALIAGATALISGTFAKFADGGIVSGPTMGLVGEYPGARSNPEVIAPLNKLQGMIGGAGGAANVNVTGSVRVDGQDLLIAIERANETAGRIY